jgi:hypothetical protein
VEEGNTAGLGLYQVCQVWNYNPCAHEADWRFPMSHAISTRSGGANGCLLVWRAISKRYGLPVQVAGFRGVSMQPFWKSGFQRNRLMTRSLPEPPWRRPARGGGGADEQQAVDTTGGETRESDGVFIWKAEVHR